jgi:hypothetical protein
MHWLLPIGEPDNGKPAVSETYSFGGVEPHFIGAAMRYGVRHAAEQRLCLGRGHLRPEETNNAAHLDCPKPPEATVIVLTPIMAAFISQPRQGAENASVSAGKLKRYG